jgi:hypothetical protein
MVVHITDWTLSSVCFLELILATAARLFSGFSTAPGRWQHNMFVTPYTAYVPNAALKYNLVASLSVWLAVLEVWVDVCGKSYLTYFVLHDSIKWAVLFFSYWIAEVMIGRMFRFEIMHGISVKATWQLKWKSPFVGRLHLGESVSQMWVDEGRCGVCQWKLAYIFQVLSVLWVRLC